VSVQLEALADEAFNAGAAHARAGTYSVRRPFGEVIWNPVCPDLIFVNVIQDLVAPDWTVADLERAVREELSGARRVRINSRHAETITRLSRPLAAAGYESETRVGMVQVDMPSAPGSGLSIRKVETSPTWAAFDELNRVDIAEAGGNETLTQQLIDLCHWRAANTAHHYFLAYQADGAVACLGLFQDGTTAYLHSLFTHPAHRRMGAGSDLMLAVSEQALAMGCQRIALRCTRDSGLPAFYARLGFRAVGEQQVWTKPAAS
jgi:GNAT superfamily N-acetyltransferase